MVRQQCWNGSPQFKFAFDRFLSPAQVRTTEVLLGVIAAQKPPLAFRPGTAFEYSSFGYDLAALAAARAGRKPYAELLKERFFQPLGITSAFVRPGRFSDFPGIRTLGYRRDFTVKSFATCGRDGRWVMPDGKLLKIESSPSRLSIVQDGVSYRMVHISPSAFYVPGLDYMIGFAGAKIYVSSSVDERWGRRVD